MREFCLDIALTDESPEEEMQNGIAAAMVTGIVEPQMKHCSFVRISCPLACPRRQQSVATCCANADLCMQSGRSVVPLSFIAALPSKVCRAVQAGMVSSVLQPI